MTWVYRVQFGKRTFYVDWENLEGALDDLKDFAIQPDTSIEVIEIADHVYTSRHIVSPLEVRERLTNAQ